jgi:hypothetical protein
VFELEIDIMAKKKAAASAAPAAAKPEVNKSQAIRDYLKANRKAMPKAVVEALKGQGIEVSSQMVSTVKFTMQQKKGGKKKQQKGGGKAASNGQAEMVSLNALIDAKKLIDKVGSIEKVKAALATLAKLG